MISPDSAIAFNIKVFGGDFGVRFYSLTMFLAIILGTALSCFIAKKYYKEVNTEKILDMLPVLVICALICARAYYVLLDWSFYSAHPNEILAVYHGGLSIHGAILGGFLGAFFYLKKYTLPIWKYADVCTYGLILGQAIGRLGNYFNTEAFGAPCSWSEKFCLFVPEPKRPLEFLDVEFFHPTFLYEMIWNIFVLLILFFVVRKFAKNYDGVVFFSYLILYSLGRLFIEHLRTDSVLNVGTFHIAEIVSVILILLGLVMICLKIKKNN